MIKHGMENFNYDNPLEDKLPNIIEAFVAVYGEKYRQQIVERLNSCTCFFVENSNSLSSLSALDKYFIKLKLNATEEEKAQLDSELKRLSTPFAAVYKNACAINKSFNENYEKLAKKYFMDAFGCDESVLPDNCFAYYQKVLMYQQGKAVSEITRSKILHFLHKITKGLPSYRQTLSEYIGKPTAAEREAYSKYYDMAKEQKEIIAKISPVVQSFNKRIAPLNLPKDSILRIKNSLSFFLIKQSNSRMVASTIAPPLQNDFNRPQSFCFFPPLFETTPGVLLHELGHVVQTNFPEELGFSPYAGRKGKVGIAATSDDKRQDLQKLEDLDEVLNEYLTYKVEERIDKTPFAAHEEYMFSSYTLAIPLLKDFFDENLDELIECAMSSDPELIFKKFPKKEILQLSSAIKRLEENSQTDNVHKQIQEGYDEKQPRLDYLANFKPSGSFDIYQKIAYEITWLTDKIRLQKSQMSSEDFNEEEKI